MIRSCIRQAVRVFAGAALIACAITAQAANITISAANCASYSTTTDQSGNVTITCVPANGTGPIGGCSISAQSPTGTIGVKDTLTAVCSSGAPPIGYTWAGGNCGNVTIQSCDALEQSAGTVGYSVVIHDASGPGNDKNPSTSILWSATAPAKPTGCSVTPTPSSLSASGGNVSLTAQCTGGNPVNWVWSGATYTSTSGNTASAAISTTTTFTATATNGGGSTAASTQVQVGQSANWPVQCFGDSTASWDSPWGSWILGKYGALGPNQAVSIRFSTGSATSNTSATFVASNGNFVAVHDFTLSTQPCGGGTVLKSTSRQGMSIDFTIGGTGRGTNLQPNSTYYITLTLSPGETCTGTDCDYSVINLLKPQGM